MSIPGSPQQSDLHKLSLAVLESSSGLTVEAQMATTAGPEMYPEVLQLAAPV